MPASAHATSAAEVPSKVSTATVPVIVHARPFDDRVRPRGTRRRSREPSAFITQRSPLSTPRPRLLPKMIDLPSRVKTGVMSSAALEVKRRCSVPSARTA